MPDEKPIIAHTRHGDLTLDQIAEMQPGLATLMRDISDRYWIAYYAAKGGNWALAAYQLRALGKRLADGALTRPKHKGMLESYAKQIIEPLLAQCAAKDWTAFEKTYQAGITLANQMHTATKYGHIQWKLPATPPPHLDLGPQ